MSNVYDTYRKKLTTPEEAVKIVKSGDWVDYTTNVCFPYLLDGALAKRKDELWDVKIRGNLLFGPIQTVEADPTREHFYYNSWHCSSYERHLCDVGLCNFIPMIFRSVVPYYTHFLTVNVAMMAVPPMDRHGYFNLSCATGVARGILEKADVVILEVNEKLPQIYGYIEDSIHIDQVDMVVEGGHPDLPEFPILPATDAEKTIAAEIIPFIKDGATLQLGIGSVPNVIGALIAKSDLKDLGMHTELCGDAYYVLHEAGKLTNRRKKLFRDKGVLGMAFGSRKMYDWLDCNPGVIAAPLAYVNAPEVIGQMDDVVSINNCISVDLYGQISSESAGTRHISGTGGQLDFLTGAAMSKGGKAFICMTSSFVDKKGVRHSRIVPTFAGDIITSPRSQAYYVVTEYGVVNLTGRTTWERAELLISIAHPDFRQQLIEEAEKLKIWRGGNRFPIM
ncbi:MAG: butyryl-CoA:acetate CoA-transferase [Solobacterium sp.]|nr:butyryl-CoA:acetate CoA-transferase [Solobacterium sp.]